MQDQGDSSFPYRELCPEITLCDFDNRLSKLEGYQDDPGHLVGVGVAETRGLWGTEPKD